MEPDAALAIVVSAVDALAVGLRDLGDPSSMEAWQAAQIQPFLREVKLAIENYDAAVAAAWPSPASTD